MRRSIVDYFVAGLQGRDTALEKKGRYLAIVAMADVVAAGLVASVRVASGASVFSLVGAALVFVQPFVVLLVLRTGRLEAAADLVLLLVPAVALQGPATDLVVSDLPSFQGVAQSLVVLVAGALVLSLVAVRLRQLVWFAAASILTLAAHIFVVALRRQSGIDVGEASWMVVPLVLLVMTCLVASLLYKQARDLMRASEQRGEERVRHALDESEERYRDLFNGVFEGILVHREGTILDANTVAEEMTGLAKGDLVGSSLAELADPADSDVFARAVQNSLAHPERVGMIFGAGRRRVLEVISKPVRYGDLASRIVSLRDITEHYQVERALEHNIRFLQTLLDTIPNPLYYKALDGTYVDCNRAFASYVGRSKDQIMGRTARGFLPEDEARRHEEHDEQLFVHRLPETRETRIHHADGSVRDVIFNKAPFFGPGETMLGLVGVIIDITDRKRMEIQLLEAKELADDASKAKSRFLAHMSHELRTPLNAILGYAQILLKAPEEGAGALPTAHRDRVRAVERNGRNLLLLINDILDMTRIEERRLTLTPSELSLRSFVNELMETFRPSASEKGLRLRSRIDPSAPARIVTDENKLRQILVNLMGNAVKFSAEGTVTLSVSPSLDGASPALSFSVADTGVGIDPDQIERIFIPFARLADNTQGTGLGLAISRELVRFLGGELGVTSAPGQGSTFSFSIGVQVVGAEVGPEPGGGGSEDQARVGAPGQGPLGCADPDLLARLRRLADTGDIAGIAAELRDQPTGRGDFCDELGRLVASFEIDRIRSLLASVGSQS